MEKILLITEKPDAANNFAIALGGTNGTFSGYSYSIISLSGHILKMPYPDELAHPEYKQIVGKFADTDGIPWSPMYFDFSKRVISPNRNGDTHINERRVKNISNYLNNGYIPVIATDQDDSYEGDGIVWEILDYLNYKGNVYREYHEDEVPDAIRDAISNMKIVDRTDVGYILSRLRSSLDYMTMQETRVASKCVRDEGYDPGTHVPAGRLQSVVLNKVGSQIDAINAYVPSSRFEPRYQLDELLLSNPDIESFQSMDDWDPKGLPKTVKVKEIKQTPGTTKPPKPLTFTELNKIMASNGYSLKYAQKLADTLYHAHIISYPRSPESTVKPKQFSRLLTNLHTILDLLSLPSAAFTHLAPRSSHVSPVGSHGALHPGAEIPESLEWLDQTYGKGASLIYKVIANRAVMMFLEDTEWIRHTYETVGTPVPFRGSVRIITKQGVTNPEDDKSDIISRLPNLSNDAELIPYEIKSRRPKTPTISWLLDVLDKEGVGTEATRPQTVARMIGDTPDYPIVKSKTNESLTLSPLGLVGYEFAKLVFLGDSESTRYIQQKMKDVANGAEQPANVMLSFVDIIKRDVEIMRAADISFGHIGLEKKMDKKIVEGMWNGNFIRYNGIFRGYEFSDEENDKLLSGESITITIPGNNGQSPQTVTGLLRENEFEGRPYVGFTVTGQVGYAFGVWKNTPIKFKSSFWGRDFTQDEIDKLLADERIQFTITNENGVSNIRGKLEVQTFDAPQPDGSKKEIKFVGFKPEFLPQEREGHVVGEWKGKMVSYRNSFMDHVFTDDENRRLQAGEMIQFETHKDTDKGHQTYNVEGKLMNQSFTKQEDGQTKTIKYVGFKANFIPDKREGYVVGRFKGWMISYKDSYMGHTFSDDENRRLLNGETIMFTGMSSDGVTKTISGCLESEIGTNGREYIKFKRLFSDAINKWG